MEDIDQVKNLISPNDGEQVSKMASTKKQVTITMPEYRSKMAERKKIYEHEMADMQCTWRPNENVEMMNMHYDRKPKAQMADTQISEESSKKVNMAEIPRMVAIRNSNAKEEKMADTKLSIRSKMDGQKIKRINDSIRKREEYTESYTRGSNTKDEETGDNLGNNNTTMETTAVICETKGEDNV